MNNAMFFDDNGPISPEEAYRRLHARSEQETEAALQAMGLEYVEELDSFIEDYILTHLQQVNTCVTAIVVAASVGDMSDIFNTIFAAMSAGAVGYRDLVVQTSPEVVDAVDCELHKEADLIRQEGRRDHGPDEAAA